MALTTVPKLKYLVFMGGAMFKAPEVVERVYSAAKIDCTSLHFIGNRWSMYIFIVFVKTSYTLDPWIRNRRSIASSLTVDFVWSDAVFGHRIQFRGSLSPLKMIARVCVFATCGGITIRRASLQSFVQVRRTSWRRMASSYWGSLSIRISSDTREATPFPGSVSSRASAFALFVGDRRR